MEDKLFTSLKLREEEEIVLDAGCGDASVAIYLAGKMKGGRLHAMDVLEGQVSAARKRVTEEMLKKNDEERTEVIVRQGDYHQLPFEDSSLTAIYTIETLVHATDLKRVLGEFYRVLRPGGRVALYEYDHWSGSREAEGMDKVRLYGAISGNEAISGNDRKNGDGQGLGGMLGKVGFVEIQEEDITANVKPLLRFFCYCLYLPYLLVVGLGLEHFFINTVAVVVNYRNPWRYVAVTAVKG
ncbi:hypothetical protein ASPZODRAFT_1811776 [Penicilliopsis zonata CBS 506.65]|uniref:Methyltransferase type 11 domain-containing protein n=1 Tax=Penicilliopsis zonata CBS 506.65 TaxID=1073090 RepID=A0A1L9SL89_9EURO|nr:hypothetical protein ASPZODRAFT_1811776 [Penicilliopsis zonata CBS 506.65]OJJ47940.1 hypothetical protein ASPZODRAFT_1811776 [Penicilliopsis zonata CBS 506.65]